MSLWRQSDYYPAGALSGDCATSLSRATWHVAVTLTRQTPQTQKSAMLLLPLLGYTLPQFAVYKT